MPRNLRNFFTVLIIIGASTTSLYGVWLIFRTVQVLIFTNTYIRENPTTGFTLSLFENFRLAIIGVIEALLVGLLTYLRWIPRRLGMFLSFLLIAIALLVLTPLWIFLFSLLKS
jgi:hypothetical protein